MVIGASRVKRIWWFLLCSVAVVVYMLVSGGKAHAQEEVRVLWAEYDPPVITSLHRGPVSFEVVVAGDVSQLWFHPVTFTLGYDTPERLVRTATRLYGGHLASVFSGTIDELVVVEDVVEDAPDGVVREKHLPYYFVRVPIGYLSVSRDYVPLWYEEAYISILRVPLNLPQSQVRRINERVQYASHVVNLVLPTFGDVVDSYGSYDLREVAHKFYDHFGDDYDAIGVVPHASGANSTPAYHESVQNRIGGIGLETFDHSRNYGSEGRLRAMHVYPLGVGNYIVIHETAHQWWEFWDWETVAGVENADGVHGPDYSIPATGRQYGARTFVAPNGEVEWEAVPRRDSIPYLKSPVTLYKMGYIGPQDVPEIIVFQTEEKTLPGDTTPTVYLSPLRTVHINDFIAVHGPRTGPKEGDTWRMATVVVTRDRLLSPEMMSIYNWQAARLAALPGHGDGPSFFEATDGYLRLRTDVRPTGRAQLDPPTPVDVMPFMPVDIEEIPGLRFDSPLATRIVVGARVVVKGEITDQSALGEASGRVCASWNGKDQVLWHISKRSCAELSASGRFRLEWAPFAAEETGGYSLRFVGVRERPFDIDGFWVTEGSDVPTTVSPTGQERIVGGQRLYPGQFIRARRAACRLELQSDGNLVAYAGGEPYWEAGTDAGTLAAMEDNGNFVIYDALGVPLWSTGTGENPGARLTIQNDCIVIVHDPNGTPLWKSGTPLWNSGRVHLSGRIRWQGVGEMASLLGTAGSGAKFH